MQVYSSVNYLLLGLILAQHANAHKYYKLDQTEALGHGFAALKLNDIAFGKRGLCARYSKIVHGCSVLDKTDGATAKAGSKCAFPFIYKGMTYRRCTTADAAFSWCYVRHKGSQPPGLCQEGGFCRWGKCASRDSTHTFKPHRKLRTIDTLMMSCGGGWTCGNMIATARSVAVFMQALLGSWEGKTSQLIDRQLTKEMKDLQPLTQG